MNARGGRAAESKTVGAFQIPVIRGEGCSKKRRRDKVNTLENVQVFWRHLNFCGWVAKK